MVREAGNAVTSEACEAVDVVPGATAEVECVVTSRTGEAEFVGTSSGATDVVPGEAIPLRSFGRLV